MRKNVLGNCYPHLLRNVAFLTLAVFMFMLFTPVLMQPKEAEAETCSTSMCETIIGEVIESLSENGLEAVYSVCNGFLNAAGKHIHNKVFKHNRCSKCKKTSCSGQTEQECKLDSGDGNPAGCGEKLIYACDDHNGYHCQRLTCSNHAKYRNCSGGHTCTPISASSYSGSYW